MNGDKVTKPSSFQRIPRDRSADAEATGSEIELVLSAVTELTRSHRQLLEIVQRIEADLGELRARVEAPLAEHGADEAGEPPWAGDAWPLELGAAEDAEAEPAPDAKPAPLSEAELLRAIQHTLNPSSGDER